VLALSELTPTSINFFLFKNLPKVNF